MSNSNNWYILKEKDTGSCTIVSVSGESEPEEGKKWGPFASKEDAIARRVGLIRAGKCKPV